MVYILQLYSHFLHMQHKDLTVMTLAGIFHVFVHLVVHFNLKFIKHLFHIDKGEKVLLVVSIYYLFIQTYYLN